MTDVLGEAPLPPAPAELLLTVLLIKLTVPPLFQMPPPEPPGPPLPAGGPLRLKPPVPPPTGGVAADGAANECERATIVGDAAAITTGIHQGYRCCRRRRHSPQRSR